MIGSFPNPYVQPYYSPAGPAFLNGHQRLVPFNQQTLTFSSMPNALPIKQSPLNRYTQLLQVPLLPLAPTFKIKNSNLAETGNIINNNESTLNASTKTKMPVESVIVDNPTQVKREHDMAFSSVDQDTSRKAKVQKVSSKSNSRSPISNLHDDVAFDDMKRVVSLKKVLEMKETIKNETNQHGLLMISSLLDEIVTPQSEKERKESRLQIESTVIPNRNFVSDWTVEEDELLLDLQREHGNDWERISKQFTNRPPPVLKSRFRSILNAGRKEWTQSEDDMLKNMIDLEKKSLDQILPHFPKRTKRALSERYRSFSMPSKEMIPLPGNPVQVFFFRRNPHLRVYQRKYNEQ